LTPKRGLLALAFAAFALAVWLSAPFRAVVWGATWGNNLAWLESLAAAALVAFWRRDQIGHHAAAWWDKHHGPHAVKRQRQALAEHEEAKGQENPQ
jgi:hypothetical protein